MDDEFGMNLALQQAMSAARLGEVPIGAIIVQGNRIVGQGFNRRETWRDPTAHAEMIAIRDASETLGGWRLPNCTLYVTVEPCAMCAGAILQARIERVVFGVADPKAGCAGTLYNLLQDERMNHRVEVTSGVCAEACASLLSHFFQELRDKRRDGRVAECARLESE